MNTARDTVSADRSTAAVEPGGDFGRLPHLGLLRFAGPDALSFLQGQVSNDTRRLEQRLPLLAAYSTPQGRVIAVLTLLPHSSGVMALLPRELATPTLERLRKFVLRAKVKIEDVSDRYGVIGAFGAGAARRQAPGIPLPDASAGYLERDGVGVAPVAGGAVPESNRYWVIRPAEVALHPDASADAQVDADAGTNSAANSSTSGNTNTGGSASTNANTNARTSANASIDASADAHVGADAGTNSAANASTSANTNTGGSADAVRIEHAWRLADIRAGLPQVYASTSEQFVAQMLNLDLLDGISFNKGCYTGQEIIARAQHLGRIKRRMFRLRLPAGSWSVGQAVRLADGRSGRLTELAAVGAGFEALAVLNLEAGAVDAESTSSGAPAAEELPLPYALTTP
jgi:folate-binding protein YgfZ